MIPLLFQDHLIKTELPKLFEGFTLKNVEGDYAPINIYSQYLPAKKKRNDIDHFPFLIVSLIKGKDAAIDQMFSTDIYFMAGVYDDNENNQGYRDAINIIQKIYNHLMRKRIINKKFEIQWPVNWVINEEDTSPFFFAGLLTNWNFMKVQNDERFI